MAWMDPEWENAEGVKVLRICANPELGHAGDKHWPRAVLMDLSSEQFNEFQREPLRFAQKHKLYPEQEILWMTDCARPPVGKGIPKAAPGTHWIVVLIHTIRSMATAAACPVDLRDSSPEKAPRRR